MNLLIKLVLAALLLIPSACTSPGQPSPLPEVLPRLPDGTIDWEKVVEDGREIWEGLNPPEPQPTPAPEPPPPEPGRPQPTPPPSGVDTGRGAAYNRLCPGGSNTFLWKPHSESTGGVFILTGHNRRLETRDVTIGRRDAQGKWLQVERSDWHRSQEACVNGGRLHWKLDRAGGQYAGPLWVRERTFAGHIYEYHIPNPGGRYEYGGGGQRVLSVGDTTYIDLTDFEVDYLEHPDDEGPL